jgi:hypothetical protein
LIVNFDSGEMEFDPNWCDPCSMAHWYADGRQISHAMRNDRFLLARLDNSELFCVDTKTLKVVWRQPSSSGVHFSDSLEDTILNLLPGAIEIVDVATGKSRVVKPADLGLPMTIAATLPTAPPRTSDDIDDNASDWMNDRLLLAAPALPLLIWGVYRLYQWQHARRARSAEVSGGQRSL